MKNTLTEYSYQFVPKYGLIYCHIPASFIALTLVPPPDKLLGFVLFNMCAFALWYGSTGTMTIPYGVMPVGPMFFLNRAKDDARQDPKMVDVVSKINALEAKRDKADQQEQEKYLNRKV